MVAACVGVCLVACSSAPKRGLGEACNSDSDCATNSCNLIASFGLTHYQQCSSFCNMDSDCRGTDPRGICAGNNCYLSCSKDSDCPVGAGCGGTICVQPAH
jgi:hypothetical protein